MKYLDYQEALSKGATEQDIADFVKTNPQIEIRGMPSSSGTKTTPQPQVVPTPSISTPSLPDYVSPLAGEARMTQSFGENGYAGEDLAYSDPSQSAMTNPIGGVPFSGTIARDGRYAGYGNYYGVIGASPEELAQMTPEEKVRMYTVANEYMAQNPENIAGMQALFPGKNINLQGHLAEPVPSGMEVATGSAQMNMGSTGHSTGRHLHNELLNTQGQLSPLSQMLQQELRKRIGR